MGIDLVNYDPFRITSFQPPTTVINPTMNKIVYLKNEQFLCKWTEILNFDLVPAHQRPTSKVQMKFKVGSNYADRFACKNKKADVSIILRCCAIVDGGVQPLQRDDYPIGLSLHIGSRNCTSALPREIAYSSSDEKKRASIPTILNDCLSKDIINGRVEAELSMSFRSDDKTKSKKRYAMAVILGEKRSIGEILDEIISRPKRSIDDFMKDLHNFMNADEDILLEKATISLASSITATRIKIPIRGINCSHLLIDDLTEYLQTNEETEKWDCKICKKSMRPDEIIIDQFYSDLLSRNKAAMEVDLNKDAKITVTKSQDHSSGEELSDDENIKEGFIIKRVSPKKNLNKEVIVIGDSSDEESTVTHLLQPDVAQPPSIQKCFSNVGNGSEHHYNSPPKLPQRRTIPHNPIQSTQAVTELKAESGDSGRRFAKKRPNGNTKEIECITLIDSSDDENNKSPPSKRAPQQEFMVDIVSSMENVADKSNFNDSVGTAIPTDVAPIVSPPSISHLISSMESLNKEPLTASHRLTNPILMQTEDNGTYLTESQQRGIESDSFLKDKPEEQMDDSDLILAYYLNKGKSDTSNFNTSRRYIDPEYESITATIKAYELRLRNSLSDE
uniref:SP-RING-type domain-containing protein n=1 Tax=Rhabditophanes sp. KR3021 TaxID=114890 RepID=A0AC35U1V2_9BILA